MSAPLLSVRDLIVEVPVEGAWRPAVNGVALEISPGESQAIVGETGCGKTLLARAVMGLAPEGARVSGRVTLRGRDLLSLSEREWARVRGRQIALVFQEPGAALDPVRTIGSQIVEALRAHESISRREAFERARGLLAEVSFPDPVRGLHEYPHRLSGGEKQRVFLAIALASRPELLIADEPTSALDATISAEVLTLLERFRIERGLALLLITHDLSAVARYTQKTLVLYAGKVVEEGSTQELLREPRHPYTRALLECVPRIAAHGTSGGRLRVIPGAVPDLSCRPQDVCAFAPRCPERFEPCEASEPPLYDLPGGRARCFLYGPAAERSDFEGRGPAGVGT